MMVVKWIGLCLLLLSPIFLMGQDMAMDTIRIEEVLVIDKRRFLIEDAGQKQTRVDSMVMMEKLTASVSELLSENTAVFIKDHGRGALATASFRGTAASHTQVFWNGLNINSPMLGMVDFSLIPSYLIDEVSLRYGGSSLGLQGGGLGGAIQLNSNPNWDNKIHVSYLQGVGSFSTFDEMLHLAIGNRKWQSKTKVYHNYSKNNYAFVNKSLPDKPLVLNENAQYGKKGISQEFYYRANGHALFSAKAWGQLANRSLPAVMSFEGDEQSNLNRQTDQTLKLVADYLHYAGAAKLYVRSGFDFQSLLYRLDNRVSGVGIIPAIFSESNMKSWYNHAKLEWKPMEKLAVHASADGNFFDIATRDSVTKAGYEAQRADFALSGSVYAQPFSWLNVSALVRNERNGQSWSPLLFHLGSSMKPFGSDRFLIDASFSKNYHHPTLNDLHWQPGGNPDLQPETGLMGEFTVRYLLRKDKFMVDQSLTAYRSEVDNWIIWLPGFKGYWEPFNVKKVNSYGVEYQVKAETVIDELKLSLVGNYSLTRSVNQSSSSISDASAGKQLPFIPVHSGNVLLGAEFRRFSLRFQHNSYSERFVLTSNEAGLLDHSSDLGIENQTGRMSWYYPYFMNHVTLGRKFKLNKLDFSIDFSVKNLFDETYRSVLGRYMPGRNYQVVMRVGFSELFEKQN